MGRGLSAAQIQSLMKSHAQIKVLVYFDDLSVGYCTGHVGAQYDGHMFEPRAIKIGSVVFGKPRAAVMNVVIDDIDNELSELITSNGELTGTDASVVLLTRDDDGYIGDVELISGVITRTNMSGGTVSVTIDAGKGTVRGEALMVGARSCGFRFKGPLCQYSGTDTTCKHTWDDCKSKHNKEHFGGFRFALLPGARIMVASGAVRVDTGGYDGYTQQNNESVDYSDCYWWEMYYWNCEESSLTTTDTMLWAPGTQPVGS